MDKLAHTFRAFRSANYRLYFGGQSVSLIGTWMQRTGVSWLVYTTTHSAFMLGLTIFAQQFPSFVFSLWGGIISDRYDRYKVLLITQTASMVQAILLAVLTLTGVYAIWQILALSVLLGIINAFDVPARQPLVHVLVPDREDIPNAMAMNSSMVNLARLLGPALSGIVLQKFGAGICFSLNAVSFLAVLISLLAMKLPTYVPPPVQKKALDDMKEGINYIKNTPVIRIALLALAAASFFLLPFDTLLPVYAKVIFNGDAATFGYISSFVGLGAICGTLFLATLKKGTNLQRMLLVSTGILAIGLILFSHSNYFPLAMAFAVVAGFGAITQNTICLTILQVQAAPEMRGRVMSFVALGYFGMLPLGSLLVGLVSQHIGAPNTLLIEGIAGLFIVAAFFNPLRHGTIGKENNLELEEAEDTVLRKI